jgi:hypothetical protein
MTRSAWNLLLYGFVLTMLIVVVDANVALHHFDQAISMVVWAVLMFNMGRVVTNTRNTRRAAAVERARR